MSDAPPTTLRAAVVLLGLEAVGMGVLAATELVDLVTKPARYPQWAIALGVVLVLLTALFAFLAYRLSGRHGGGRNTAVALNLFALPVGYYMIKAGWWFPGLLLWAVCAAAIVLLLAPPTTKALGLPPRVTRPRGGSPGAA
ncbi:MAG TPA: hypothetical protein VGD72_16570 [Mycobacteriales bacterium]